jgi:chromosomal replication initiator protein
VKLADLLSERRTANIVRPRQVSVYLAKELTRLSLPKIGRSTGGRDHSTAFSSIKKIERLIASDADLRDRVNEIKAALGVAHA